MGCPSIEWAIRLTTLDLIDIRPESFPSSNRHIKLVCKLVAELLAAKGLLNIHEGLLKMFCNMLVPPPPLPQAFQHVFATNTHSLYLATHWSPPRKPVA